MRDTVVPVLSWTLIVFPVRYAAVIVIGSDEFSFIEHVSFYGREEFILAQAGVRIELGI